MIEKELKKLRKEYKKTGLDMMKELFARQEIEEMADCFEYGKIIYKNGLYFFASDETETSPFLELFEMLEYLRELCKAFNRNGVG